jgi:hypothetical protein
MVKAGAVVGDRLEAARQAYDIVSARWGVLLEVGDSDLKGMGPALLAHYVVEHERTEALAHLPANERPSEDSEMHAIQDARVSAIEMLARLRSRLDEIRVVA